MKKLLIAALAACPGLVFAQAAIVNADGECSGYDASLVSHNDPDSNAEIIYSAGATGRWTLRCNGNLPEGVPLPSRAMFVTTEDTGTFCFGSEDWVMRVTPAGVFNLTCHGEDS